jgi:integrase
MANRNYAGHIRRRSSGSWELMVSINGRARTKTVHVRTKGEAIDEIIAWRAELLGQEAKRARGIPADWTMTQLIDNWIEVYVATKDAATKKQYEGFARRLKWYLEHELRRDPKVVDFGLAGVTLCLDWRGSCTFAKGGGKVCKSASSARTVQKERGAMRLLFERAVGLEIIPSNPVDRSPKIEVAGREPILLDDRQVAALEAQMAGPMRQLYIVVLDETAGRCGSEVLWLRWTDIDWEGGFIWVYDEPDGHRTKTRKGRWIPMTARLRARLKAHEHQFRTALYAGKRSPWVFHHTRNVPGATKGQRIGSLYRAFKSAARRAGLPVDLHQHDFRHRRITRQLADGHELAKVSKAAGHAHYSTTKKYEHLIREDLLTLVKGPSTKIDVEALLSLVDSDEQEVSEAAVTLIRHVRRTRGESE